MTTDQRDLYKGSLFVFVLWWLLFFRSGVFAELSMVRWMALFLLGLAFLSTTVLFVSRRWPVFSQRQRVFFNFVSLILIFGLIVWMLSGGQ